MNSRELFELLTRTHFRGACLSCHPSDQNSVFGIICVPELWDVSEELWLTEKEEGFLAPFRKQFPEFAFEVSPEECGTETALLSISSRKTVLRAEPIIDVKLPSPINSKLIIGRTYEGQGATWGGWSIKLLKIVSEGTVEVLAKHPGRQTYKGNIRKSNLGSLKP